MKQKIEKLFETWLSVTRFDSTGRAGLKEKEELLKYCRENKEEFQEFAKEILENPCEESWNVANLCGEVFPEVSMIEDLSFIDRLRRLPKVLDPEWSLWEPCNFWLNHFLGTTGIDYYKNYREYKEYLKDHYIPWNPFKEPDPNPDFQEWMKKKKARD